MTDKDIRRVTEARIGRVVAFWRPGNAAGGGSLMIATAPEMVWSEHRVDGDEYGDALRAWAAATGIPAADYAILEPLFLTMRDGLRRRAT